LDQLEQEELDSKLLGATPVPQTNVTAGLEGLPNVPKKEPSKQFVNYSRCPTPKTIATTT
jgi:hypothetical protein